MNYLTDAAQYIPGRGTVQRVGSATIPMPADDFPAGSHNTLAGPIIHRGLYG